MATVLEEALAYLASGWSVFPVRPKGKKPLFEWGAYTERLPTADEVREWWGRWPDANIAMVTGRVSELVVVDVDTKKGASPKEVFDRYQTGLVSRTPSGGAHLFFRYPDGVERVPNRVGKDGIDVRGDGGYVVLPPSILEGGRAYKWLMRREPARAPEFVYEVLDKGETAGGSWLKDLLTNGAAKGQRNDSCARLAGYFAEKSMAKEVALTLLTQWNERNDPPIPLAEVEVTLDSVYRTAARRQRANGENKPALGDDGKPRTFGLMSFGSYMSRYGDDAVQWAIEEWLPVNTVAFTISPPGSFKTWVVLDLAVSIASGRPFLGKFPVLSEPGPVIIIQQEDYHGQLAERLGIMTASKFGIQWSIDPADKEQFEAPNPPNLPIYLHPDRLLKFDDPVILDSLEEQIRRIRPKLVILDPLYSAGNTDDYMAKTAEQMFVFKRWRDRYNCSFLAVHHTKKTTEGSSMREGAWGSQFLNAFLETGWQIRRVADMGDNTVSIQRHFKVKGTMPPLALSFDISTEFPNRYEVSSEVLDEDKLEERSNIVGLIEKEGPMQVGKIAEKIGLNRSTVSRKVSALIKNGALMRDDAGLISLPKLPEI